MDTSTQASSVVWASQQVRGLLKCLAPGEGHKDNRLVTGTRDHNLFSVIDDRIEGGRIVPTGFGIAP